MEIDASRPKASSYSSGSSVGSYSSALPSTPGSRASPTKSGSPAQVTRAYSGNCRSSSRERSHRVRRSINTDAVSAAVSPMQPRQVQSNVTSDSSASPKQVVARANSPGKPPVQPTSSSSPQGRHPRTSAGSVGSSNRSTRSHSTGSSPMYARLQELNDVAEQTSAYVSSRGRRMSAEKRQEPR
ncbi:hypothetical protein PHYSODRAFT_507687 [Phytophthora sojae]|uniref:Uncharacterized protein n=1 Tax=Phytophthora sojae (strain P6497) TaxID=1094619 RepID=G4ZMZ9_PHYSP|nr:hypothetical protein PHYSODRAFT_507687 [Phytophthora sojae]EGZ15028.1 hypothetical protein PHYSODRAFT_507687 [Phytophthora sojae]|eukprot:XP_009528777.1 hypothetical protein PHYSODRAFT_507687 [Phytophthora sojae]